MKKCFLSAMSADYLSVLDITAPEVPPSVQQFMPSSSDSFALGLLEVLRDALMYVRPDIREAAAVCLGILAMAMAVSVLKTLPGTTQRCVNLVGVVSAAALLLDSANSMIRMGADTIREISEYGKLLLPVMTAALAAQGGVTVSAAVYSGTLIFDAVLSGLISKLLVPMIYVYLALSVTFSASGEQTIRKLQAFLKWLVTWSLKTILYIFTGFIGLTGVITGTTDAAALKAAKLTISGVVPVVGGILSDASETMLVGAAAVKNAAGIYGMCAVVAICVGPFLRIGAHYLLLKFTSFVTEIIGNKELSDLISDFSGAMGMLLGMTASTCMMLMISTVCFMKGVG